MRTCTKREVSKEEFEAFLNAHPGLKFDGMRYTEPVQMKGGVWNKPLAAKIGDKFVLIEDQ